MQEYIYTITCTVNNKRYVGRTCNHSRRKQQHFRKLLLGTHQNKYLQSSYNKYGLENFRFDVIEETTPEFVKERELYWFDYFKIEGVVLFNYVITSSNGGIDSKTHITRTYIFEVLDSMYSENIGIKEGSIKFKTSTVTIAKYIPEWEQITGNKFCRQPQVAETLKKMVLFVEAWKREGDSATRRLKDFKLSHYSLVKYLPKFNLSFDDVRLDDLFRTTRSRALEAIRDIENGMSLVDAWKKNNISSTTYYKYLKEQGLPCISKSRPRFFSEEARDSIRNSNKQRAEDKHKESKCHT